MVDDGIQFDLWKLGENAIQQRQLGALVGGPLRGSDARARSVTAEAFVEAAGWGGPNIWFVAVPEPKPGKNRVHLDLRAPGPIADEVARLVSLGATVVHEQQDLVSLRDPEGNEFCVE